METAASSGDAPALIRWAEGAPIVCALASAGILAAASRPWGTFPLAAIALVPWLVALRGAGWGAASSASFALGTLYGMLVARWFPQAMGELGAASGAAATGFLTAAVWVQGVPFLALGLVVRATRSLRVPPRVVVVAIAVYAIDWLRSAAGWGVPFALLGHTQRPNLGLAQLAVVGGGPLLSAAIAATNQAIAEVCVATNAVQTARRAALACLAALCVMSAVGLPLAEALAPKATGTERRLLAMQPNFPRGARWAEERQAVHLARIVFETERAIAGAATRPDVIIWPENLLTSPIDQSPLDGELTAAVAGFQVPLVLGAVRNAVPPDPERYRSSVLWVDPVRGVVGAIDKQRAIPVIEAADSGVGSQILRRLFGGAAEGKHVQEAAASAGPLRGELPLVVALCYEGYFPALVARRRAPTSLAILHLADEGWARAPLASEQLADLVAFRAIEQRLPLVRVTHGGPSVLIDPFGRRVRALPRDAYAHMTVAVWPRTPPGFTEKLALAAVPLSTGLGVWWLVAVFERRRARASTATTVEDPPT